MSLAVDLGLRISDFIALKKADLPSFDGEAPIAFDVLTEKEKVAAKCFLSQESVSILKTYLSTLQNKKNNVYLFSSNGESHVSDESVGKMLKKLVVKAQISLNGKRLTFHCFRKMFLSGSIDSGIGLTAGKLLCGKAIPRSDGTYLTTVKLREKFIQLKRFLSINVQPRVEVEKVESLKKAVSRLQEELMVQKTITEAVSERNLELKAEMEALNKGQSVLERKVDAMSTVFQKTFADLVEESVEVFGANLKKSETGKKEEKSKGSVKA